MSDMSTNPSYLVIPTWTLADRLRKSREAVGFDQVDIANRLAKKRSTISNWERGKNRPDELALRAWAHETRVPLEWLKHGTDPGDGTGDEATDVTYWRRPRRGYPPTVMELTPLTPLQKAS